jgi:hypothetical protein
LTTTRNSVRVQRDRWEQGIGYLERETFDAFLQLPAPQRKLIREVILTFAKVHGEQNVGLGTAQPTHTANQK